MWARKDILRSQHIDVERDRTPERTQRDRLREREFKRQRQTLFETERYKEPEI